MQPKGKSVPLSRVEASDALPLDTSWLQPYTQALRDRVASLDLRLLGFDPYARPILLQELYTDLHGSLDADAATPREKRTTLDTIVDTTRAVLLLGDSGSGKTTFLRHLAARCLTEGQLTPVLLEVADFNELGPTLLTTTRKLPANTLPRWLAQTLAEVGLPVTLSDIERFAAHRRVIWLLDGFNEVVDPRLRREFGSLLRSSRVAFPESSFVVTATDAVVRDASAPARGMGGFEHVFIDRFRPSDVRVFLDRFLAALRPSLTESQRQDAWQPLAHALLQTPEMESLVASPLNLTALAIILSSTPTFPMEPELPSCRVDLFQNLISWTLRNRSASLPDLVGEDVFDVLGRIAYAMVTADPGPQSRAGVSQAAHALSDAGFFRGDLAVAERAVRGLVEAGVGLEAVHVVPPGRDASAVGDARMQDAARDYFASWHLVMGVRQRPSWQDVLRHYIDDPSRRGFVHLTAGHLLKNGSPDADQFFRWLAGLSYAQKLQVRLGRVALGGSILRELRAAGYTSQLPEWHTLLGGVAELFHGDLRRIPLRTRYEAAIAFGLDGDIRFQEFDSAWAEIPSHPAVCGAQAGDASSPNFDISAAPWEGPVRVVQVASFSIRQYPLSVAEFQLFARGCYENPRPEVWDPVGLEWLRRNSIVAPADWNAQLLFPNTPVTGVSWFEAQAYCRWLTLTRNDGFTYRLPHESEWETCARRGPRSPSVFPWGNSISWGDGAEANWAGALLRRKSPIGMFPLSNTRDGVVDMFGNVEEWCLESWADLDDDCGLPSLAGAGPDEVPRIVRGGSCIRFSRLMRPSYRSRVIQTRRYHTVGFRLVRTRDS